MSVSFTSTIGRRFGLTRVEVIHHRGEPDESRDSLECQYQGKAGYFDIDAPISEGDFVELPDPRSSEPMQHYVRSVEINHSPFNQSQSHIKANWGTAPRARRPSVINNTTTINVTGSHNAVSAGAGAVALAHHIADTGPAEYQSLSAAVAHILESLADLGIDADETTAVLDAAAPLLESLQQGDADPSVIRKFAVGLKNAVAGIAHSASAGANVAVVAFANEQTRTLLDHIQSMA